MRDESAQTMHITDIQADVEAFMRAMDQSVRAVPTQGVDQHTLMLRYELIKEEYLETRQALGRLIHVVAGGGYASAGNWLHDCAQVVDGIVDLIYVLVGTASAMGVDLQPVWEEVHRSNMAKKDGPIAEDGKRLKPAGWTPPAVERVIREQVAESDFADRKIG